MVLICGVAPETQCGGKSLCKDVATKQFDHSLTLGTLKVMGTFSF